MATNTVIPRNAPAAGVYKQQQKHGTEGIRIVVPRPDEAWMAWPAAVGFSFTAKCWGHVLVEDLAAVEFRAAAFDQLVLPPEQQG